MLNFFLIFTLFWSSVSFCMDESRSKMTGPFTLLPEEIINEIFYYISCKNSNIREQFKSLFDLARTSYSFYKKIICYLIYLAAKEKNKNLITQLHVCCALNAGLWVSQHYRDTELLEEHLYTTFSIYNKGYSTALLQAVQYGNADVVKKIFIIINFNYNDAALFNNAKDAPQYSKIVELFLTEKPIESIDTLNPLIYAIIMSYKDLILYICNYHEYLINQTDTIWGSALHCGVRAQNYDAIKMLLKHNAIVDIPNKHNQSPLTIAIVDCENIIVDYAFATKRNEKSNTKLLEIITLLLEYGADKNMKSEFDSTPLTLAEAKHIDLEFLKH